MIITRPKWLTENQILIIRLVGTGSTNGEIAERLGKRPQTVKNTLLLISEKADVKGRVQLIVWALRNEIVHLDEL